MLLEPFPEKVCEFADNLFHIFRHIIGLDMRCAGDKEHFFILCACGLAETLLGHIKCVGDASGYHKQGLVYKVHTF